MISQINRIYVTGKLILEIEEEVNGMDQELFDRKTEDSRKILKILTMIIFIRE